MDLQPSEDTPAAWAFGSVRIEPAGRRLIVAGRERACSRRAFDLLLYLVERPRVVHSRDSLIDLLWPGGQVVPDEALTQAVFRLRAALGEQGERVVTVRGIGVRLDADVERSDGALAPDAEVASMPPADAPLSEIVDPPLPMPTSADVLPAADDDRPRRRQWRVPAFAAALALAVAMAIAGFWRGTGGGADAVVDASYGLYAADVHAERPDTVRLLAEGLAQEAGGRRADGAALLELAHESDSRSPFPALFLALWAIGEGNAEAIERWWPQALARAQALSDPYVAAMTRYVDAERRGDARDILRYASAVLNLRPQAWQMRLARSHLFNTQGLREAALAELVEVEVTSLGHRRLAMLLADRASFGDLAGAEAVFARLPAEDSASYHFLAGRLAWSRGDAAGARAAFLRAAERARGEGRLATVHRALTYAGVLAMTLGDHDDAVASLERARVGTDESRQWFQSCDISLILAHLRFEAGDAAGAARELAQAQRAAELGTSADLAALVVLFALRMGVGDAISEPAQLPAIAGHLLRARRALQAGEAIRAAEAVDAAINIGALETTWLDETALMLAELGRPVPPLPPIDPPHPPQARWAIRRAIAAQLATH